MMLPTIILGATKRVFVAGTEDARDSLEEKHSLKIPFGSVAFLT